MFRVKIDYLKSHERKKWNFKIIFKISIDKKMCGEGAGEKMCILSLHSMKYIVCGKISLEPKVSASHINHFVEVIFYFLGNSMTYNDFQLFKECL